MRYATRELQEGVLIVICVEEPLVYSTILFDFVYAIMILMSDHTHSRNTRGDER